MIDSEITTTILRQIRDEIVKTRGEITKTNERLDATNERLDTTNERLDTMNERFGVVEATVQGAAAQVVLLGRYVTNKHDRELGDLRKRVTRLEKKVG
jgi:chromosome segregation ATPase